MHLLMSLAPGADVLEVLRAAGLTPENAARAVACVSPDQRVHLAVPWTLGACSACLAQVACMHGRGLWQRSCRQSGCSRLAWAKEKHMAAA